MAKDDNNTTFISEDCSICQKEMTDVKKIRVIIDDDKYVCLKCVEKFNLQVLEVLDL